MSNRTNARNENNANIEQEVLEKILSNLYNYDALPSEVNFNSNYWQTISKELGITPEQYKQIENKYVKRNELGILQAISASAQNNLYIPLIRDAVQDTGSYYQVLNTDFIYFNEIIIPDELALPQEGTFFTVPNQLDAHINYGAVVYGNTYKVYFVSQGRIFLFPNYQTLEVALVERKLTYDSIQIFEPQYVEALLDKFKFTTVASRLAEWKPNYPTLAVYRPFPSTEYFLETTHDEVYEGQFFYIRLSTRRVPANRRYKYQITGVDAADIDIPLEGVFITKGNDDVAGSTIRINTTRDRRTDYVKTMVVNVDVPYDQTYGGGLRLELPIDIFERSIQTSIVTAGTYAATNVPSINLRSPNGRYAAIYQGDGNFVISDTVTDTVIRAIGAGSKTMNIQLDGNVLWDVPNVGILDRTTTAGNGPTYFKMFDDGILRLVRLLDDVSVWSSDVNLNRFDGVMIAANNSDLRRFQTAVVQGNVNGARQIYNDMLPQTRAALNRNTAANSLAFVDPTLPYNNAAWNNMQVALNSYLNGEYSLIRNVLYTNGLLNFTAPFKTYTAKIDEIVKASTELNLPDKPGKGGFGPTGEVRNLNRPGAADIGLVTERTGSGGSNDPVTGLKPGLAPPTPAPTIVPGTLDANTAARSVTITHPSVSASIYTSFGTGSEAPNSQYIRGSVLIVSAGQILRAVAEDSFPPQTSPVVSFTNVITNVVAPTITEVSTNPATNIKIARISSQIPGAVIRVVINNDNTATPGTIVANNVTVDVPPGQTLRASAAAGNITSPIGSFTNALPVPNVVAPIITLVSTNSATNIRTMQVSHPLGIGVQCKVALSATAVPATNIANNGTINLPPGQTLRASATLSGVVSPIVSYVNTLTDPANNPNPQTSTLAPTITLISTNSSTNSQTVRLTTTLTNAQLRSVVSSNAGAIPTVLTTNNSTFVLTPNQKLRATATVNNVASAITTYTNSLPPVNTGGFGPG